MKAYAYYLKNINQNVKNLTQKTLSFLYPINFNKP